MLQWCELGLFIGWCAHDQPDSCIAFILAKRTHYSCSSQDIQDRIAWLDDGALWKLGGPSKGTGWAKEACPFACCPKQPVRNHWPKRGEWRKDGSPKHLMGSPKRAIGMSRHAIISPRQPNAGGSLAAQCRTNSARFLLQPIQPLWHTLTDQSRVPRLSLTTSMSVKTCLNVPD